MERHQHDAEPKGLLYFTSQFRKTRLGCWRPGQGSLWRGHQRLPGAGMLGFWIWVLATEVCSGCKDASSLYSYITCLFLYVYFNITFKSHIPSWGKIFLSTRGPWIISWWRLHFRTSASSWGQYLKISIHAPWKSQNESSLLEDMKEF